MKKSLNSKGKDVEISANVVLETDPDFSRPSGLVPQEPSQASTGGHQCCQFSNIKADFCHDFASVFQQ